MSPTSYQTAPPRSSILTTASHAVKSEHFTLIFVRLTFMFLLRARPLSAGWQLNLYLQSVRLQVLCFNGAAVCGHGARSYRKPQTEAVCRPAGFIHTEKWFEEPRECVLRNPGPFILHTDSYLAVVAKQCDFDLSV